MCALYVKLQKKDKEAAEAAARELNDLFAVAIKQPKAPPGASLVILMSLCRCWRLLLLASSHEADPDLTLRAGSCVVYIILL